MDEDDDDDDDDDDLLDFGLHIGMMIMGMMIIFSVQTSEEKKTS